MNCHNEASAFIKELVEIGGSIRVTDEGILTWRSDGSVIKIPINNKPITARIYQSNIPAGEHCIINPYIEPLGTSKERYWFFTLNNTNLSNMVKRMIEKLAIMVVEKKDIDFDKLDMIQPYLASFDDKFLKELELIGPLSIIRMFYDKKTRVASLGTDLDDEDFRKDRKVRKRTWETLTGLLEVFFGTAELETYDYKATITCMQETDALLHLYVNVLAKIHEYVQLILGDKINVASLMNHILKLKDYHDATAWLAPTTVKEQPQAVKSMPWQPQPIVQPAFRMQQPSQFSGFQPASQMAPAISHNINPVPPAFMQQQPQPMVNAPWQASVMPGIHTPQLTNTIPQPVSNIHVPKLNCRG